jgi:hypothetical protein
MRKFLRQHGGSKGSLPRERVVVFDEAQRAWDRDRFSSTIKGSLRAPNLSSSSRSAVALRTGSRSWP